VDTGAPWAAGEAEVEAEPAETEADGEAAGLGNGLNALETWADDGGVAERVGLEVGAAGAAFCPQAASSKLSKANNAAQKRRVKCAPDEKWRRRHGDWICRSSSRYLRYGGLLKLNDLKLNSGSTCL
jgi:hypothetical protein